MWGLERLDCIRVDSANVTRAEGPRPCPLGSQFDPWLASLERPEPQTHNWFRLRLDPEKGLITEAFSQRLVEQGMAGKTTVSHMLFFQKAAYPLTEIGRARRAELQKRVPEVLHALEAGPLTLNDFRAEEWMVAFFLDAMRVLPRALGQKKQEKCLISSQALEQLLSQRCISLELAKATYEFSRDVGDLGSLLKFGFDTLDFVSNFGEDYQPGPTNWGKDAGTLGHGARLLEP